MIFKAALPEPRTITIKQIENNIVGLSNRMHSNARRILPSPLMHVYQDSRAIVLRRYEKTLGEFLRGGSIYLD